MGIFVQHEPHEACGSSDGLARYEDGTAYCWACRAYEGTNGAVDTSRAARRPDSRLLEGGEVVTHKTRGLSEDTCKKFGYKVAQDERGRWVHVAPLYNSRGQLVAQKLRYTDPKDFAVRGDLKDAQLFGQRLWQEGGKRVVVTEGEIDAMSYAQATGCRWPVVSITKGAQGAAKELARHIEWLDTYEQIVLMFDQDEHGLEASAACAELFAPGKARIAALPLKDANEMLVAGKADALVQAVFQAKAYRPDGLVRADDLWDVIRQKPPQGLPWPWEGLNKMTHGLRRGEIVTLAAGESVGKSTAVREVVAALIDRDETVGVLSFEDTARTVLLGQLGIVMNRPLNQAATYATTPEAELKVHFDAYPTSRLWIYCDELESDHLAARIRYMAHAGECHWIVLDHITALVAGVGSDQEWERIDRVMAKVRPLVRELDLGFIVVSHLKKLEKGAATEGARVKLSDLRGAALQRDSHIVIGLERDLQDEEHSNRTTVRVLKNRPIGSTGRAACLVYSQETGRLTETDFVEPKKPKAKSFAGQRADVAPNVQQEDF